MGKSIFRNILYIFTASAIVLSLSACAGTTYKDAAVTDIKIDASKVTSRINPEIFGQNMAVWEGTADGKDEEYNAAVKAMNASVLRFPGGGYADMVDWENIPRCNFSWVPINMQEGIEFAKASNVQLQLIVNYAGNWCDKDHGHDAAVKKAVDWVKYMNVTKGGAHYVKYWEIGNEQFGSGEKGYWSDDEEGGDKYGRDFVDFYKAMKKVDPKIHIGAQCQFDHIPWSVGALKAIKKGGVTPDFLIVHVYPIWMADRDKGQDWDKTLYASNPVIDGRLLDAAGYQAVSVTAITNDLVEKYLGKSYVGKLPIWCTEFRSVLEFKYDEFVDTMFCSQFLMEMGRLGWGGANIWDLKNGYDKKKGQDYGLLRTGANADVEDDNPKNSPRPTYYIYPYLSNVFGRDMVECNYPEYINNAAPGKYPINWVLSGREGNKVRVWASKDKEGNLTILLANNSTDSNSISNLGITGFDAAKEGKMWLFEAAGNTYSGESEPIAQRMHIKINGEQDPAIASLPGDGKAIKTGNLFEVKMPPVSLALIKIPAAAAAK
ncbi:MAG: hypothetical protein LLG37_11010 [Spirochaetia bacterium]|nr:hypothetical protein [Spirochaetia bacterium]